MEVCFVKNTRKLLSVKIRVQHIKSEQAVLSAEIIRKLREDHAAAGKKLFKLHFCHHLFLSVCCISLTQLLTICPVIYSLSKRESGIKHTQSFI